MPCRSDHMEPNARESESRRVAGHLCYLLPLLKQEVSEDLTHAANHVYGDPKNVDSLTAQLCSLCSSLSESETTRFIYNGRNADARKLADWWDRHQEFDKERRAKEMCKSIPLPALNLIFDGLKAIDLDPHFSHPNTKAHPNNNYSMVSFRVNGHLVSVRDTDLIVTKED